MSNRPSGLLAAALCWPGILLGADVDAALDGFNWDLEAIELPADELPAIPGTAYHGAWEWSGRMGLSSSWNLHNHQSSTGIAFDGASKLRTRLDLGAQRDIGPDWQLSLNAYAWYDASWELFDRPSNEDLLDRYRQDLNLQESWIAGRLGANTDIRIGRQVVNWGYADSLRVLDILNPLDNLEPGLADIEDLRRPRGMLRLGHHVDRWEFAVFVLPEQRFSRNPPFGSDFYSALNAAGEPVQFVHRRPLDFESPGWALSMQGRLSGFDLSVNAARLWLDVPYLDVRDFSLRHSRSNTLGVGAQWQRGSWLLKAESRFLRRVSLLESDGATLSNARRDRVDVLLGFEYFGLTRTTLAAEFAVRHTAGQAADPINEASFRVGRTFMNERLRSTLVVIRLDSSGALAAARGGGLSRLDLEFELADSLQVSVALLLYEGGDLPPFNVAADNDRINAELRWSF